MSELTRTAIWDNRSVFHSATFDYDGLGERLGNRAVGIGEAPYLDPNSLSRQEALQQDINGFSVHKTNGHAPNESISA